MVKTLRDALDAWHVVTTLDALVDSDEEIGDHHARLDYGKCWHTLYDLLLM